MNKICTSIRQSQKLMKLGIDVNTADMCWQNNEFPVGFNDDEAVPAWSLAALIDFLKPNVSLEHEEDVGWKVSECVVIEKPNSILQDVKEIQGFSEDNPVDACVEMIVKLKEMNLL